MEFTRQQNCAALSRYRYTVTLSSAGFRLPPPTMSSNASI